MPVGAAPGSTIQAQGPDGRTFDVQVPPGLSAGDTFSVSFPAAEAAALLTLTVPAGVQPGEALQFTNAHGQQVQAIMPAGVQAAHSFQARAHPKQPPRRWSL